MDDVGIKCQTTEKKYFVFTMSFHLKHYTENKFSLYLDK